MVNFDLLITGLATIVYTTLCDSQGQPATKITRQVPEFDERDNQGSGNILKGMAQHFDQGGFELATATPCNKSSYLATYETGPKPRGRKGKVTFKSFGYPGAGSYYLEYLSRASWFDARKKCQSYGADLVVLRDDKLYTHVITKLSAYVPLYWVGANDLDGDSQIMWVSGEKAVQGTKWGPGLFPHAVGRGKCIGLVRGKGLNDRRCSLFNPYMCQFSDISTSKARFQVVGLLTRGYMKVGEKLALKCEAIMLDTAQLQLNIGQEYQWSSDGSVKGNASKVMVYWSRIDQNYAYVGIRCLPWFNITLALSVTKELSGKMISCCSLNGGGSHCVNKTITVKAESRKPIVKLGPHGSATMGEDTTYTCLAMPGDGTAVAIAVVGPTETWARVITMDKRVKDTGTKPAWIGRVSYEQGYDPWWGGNHINISVELTITPAVREAPLVCYSSGEVGELVGQYGNNYTRLVEEMDTTLDEDEFTAGPLNIIFNASGVYLDSPYTIEDYESSIVAYGCDLLTFTCKGHVGTSGETLTFTVKFTSGDSDHYDTYSGERNRHPAWLAFGIQDKDDFEKGPTLVITANITVDHDIDNVTGLDCCIQDRPEPEFRSELNTSFRFAYGNTAPILTHSFTYINKHPIRLNAHCTARVGNGDTSTWELVDNLGSRYYTLVSLDGYVTAVYHHPSFRVKFTDGYRDDTCGNVIISEVAYIIDSRESVGSTLICYSLNVEDSNFTSRLTREELSARVNILGGGLIDDDDPDDGFRKGFLELLLFLLSPFMILLLVTCCFATTIGRKKKGRPSTRGKSQFLDIPAELPGDAHAETVANEDARWDAESAVARAPDDMGSVVSGGVKSMASPPESVYSKATSVVSSVVQQINRPGARLTPDVRPKTSRTDLGKISEDAPKRMFAQMY